MDEKYLQLENLLVETTHIPAPPGFEERLAMFIKGRLEEHGYTVKRDKLGNIYTIIDGGGDTLLVTAHMDEVALLVHHIDDKGRLYFKTLGGLRPNMLYSQHVIVHTSQGDVPGIIPALPPHAGKTGDSELKIEDLYIDVGAEKMEEAFDLGVKPPTPATLKPTISKIRKGEIIVGRPLDNRVSVSTLLHVAYMLATVEPKEGTLIIAWTVQEEVGIRGATALAARLQPDYLLALDVMTYTHPPVTGGYKPGRGPVLRIFDKSNISCKELDNMILTVADNVGITVQKGVGVGGTDAAAGWKEGSCSSGLMVASQYTHSTVEKIYKRDWYLQADLTLNMAKWHIRGEHL